MCQDRTLATRNEASESVHFQHGTPRAHQRHPHMPQPLVSAVMVRRTQSAILSCVELRGDFSGALGPALLDIVRDHLLELRVQLVRPELDDSALAQLHIVELDGAPLDDARRREIERALRSLLMRPLGPGLVKAHPRSRRASDSVAPL